MKLKQQENQRVYANTDRWLNSCSKRLIGTMYVCKVQTVLTVKLLLLYYNNGKYHVYFWILLAMKLKRNLAFQNHHSTP